MLNYTKICATCGVRFLSENYNRKYCSQKCSKQSYRIRQDVPNKYCCNCGVQLSDGRQQWCLNCLLDDYKNTRSSLSYKRLTNRGYDKEMIEEELKNRE